jgi:hypothetical protein
LGGLGAAASVGRDEAKRFIEVSRRLLEHLDVKARGARMHLSADLTGVLETAYQTKKKIIDTQ